MQVALPFIDINDDDSLGGQPDDGWTFLRKVRREAQTIDDVLSVGDLLRGPQKPVIQPPSFPRPAASASRDHWKEWQTQFLSMFRATRQVLKAQGRKVTAPVPAINDEQAWFDFIRRKRRTPSTHVILSLDNVTVSKLLYYFSVWLDEELNFEGHQNFSMSVFDSEWIYSLLLVLDFPVLDDSASTLSKLLRFSCLVRSQDCRSETEDALATANVIYTVITKFYGQKDHY